MTGLDKQTEEQWEKKLKIKTGGGMDHRADGENYPYEPTPYPVLVRLAESGYISRESCLLDYGCGKGRACLLLSYLTGCRATGIDYQEELIRAARKNLSSCGTDMVTFLHRKAEEYQITDEDTFFFFNPFSELILKKVLDEILWSWYEEPRAMRLMFYYPADDTVSLLMTVQELMFLDEIDCGDFFDGNDSRERILIFETETLPSF